MRHNCHDWPAALAAPTRTLPSAVKQYWTSTHAEPTGGTAWVFCHSSRHTAGTPYTRQRATYPITQVRARPPHHAQRGHLNHHLRRVHREEHLGTWSGNGQAHTTRSLTSREAGQHHHCSLVPPAAKQWRRRHPTRCAHTLSDRCTNTILGDVGSASGWSNASATQLTTITARTAPSNHFCSTTFSSSRRRNRVHHESCPTITRFVPGTTPVEAMLRRGLHWCGPRGRRNKRGWPLPTLLFARGTWRGEAVVVCVVTMATTTPPKQRAAPTPQLAAVLTADMSNKSTRPAVASPLRPPGACKRCLGQGNGPPCDDLC